MKTGFPTAQESSSYFQRYIQNVPEDVFQYLEDQINVMETFFDNLNEAKWDFRYQETKWSLKEVFIHINDTERIFAYRALSIARGELQSLIGFDQDAYMESDFSHVSSELVKKSFFQIRRSTLSLFKSFSESDWLRKGVSSGSPLSVRASAFIIAGHLDHHMKIIRERYLA